MSTDDTLDWSNITTDNMILDNTIDVSANLNITANLNNNDQDSAALDQDLQLLLAGIGGDVQMPPPDSFNTTMSDEGGGFTQAFFNMGNSPHRRQSTSNNPIQQQQELKHQHQLQNQSKTNTNDRFGKQIQNTPQQHNNNNAHTHDTRNDRLSHIPPPHTPKNTNNPSQNNLQFPHAHMHFQQRPNNNKTTITAARVAAPAHINMNSTNIKNDDNNNGNKHDVSMNTSVANSIEQWDKSTDSVAYNLTPDLKRPNYNNNISTYINNNDKLDNLNDQQPTSSTTITPTTTQNLNINPPTTSTSNTASSTEQYNDKTQQSPRHKARQSSFLLHSPKSTFQPISTGLNMITDTPKKNRDKRATTTTNTNNNLPTTPKSTKIKIKDPIIITTSTKNGVRSVSRKHSVAKRNIIDTNDVNTRNNEYNNDDELTKFELDEPTLQQEQHRDITDQHKNNTVNNNDVPIHNGTVDQNDNLGTDTMNITGVEFNTTGMTGVDLNMTGLTGVELNTSIANHSKSNTNQHGNMNNNNHINKNTHNTNNQNAQISPALHTSSNRTSLIPSTRYTNTNSTTTTNTNQNTNHNHNHSKSNIDLDTSLSMDTTTLTKLDMNTTTLSGLTNLNHSMMSLDNNAMDITMAIPRNGGRIMEEDDDDDDGDNDDGGDDSKAFNQSTTHSSRKSIDQTDNKNNTLSRNNNDDDDDDTREFVMSGRINCSNLPFGDSDDSEQQHSPHMHNDRDNTTNSPQHKNTSPYSLNNNTTSPYISTNSSNDNHNNNNTTQQHDNYHNNIPKSNRRSTLQQTDSGYDSDNISYASNGDDSDKNNFNDTKYQSHNNTMQQQNQYTNQPYTMTRDYNNTRGSTNSSTNINATNSSDVHNISAQSNISYNYDDHDDDDDDDNGQYHGAQSRPNYNNHQKNHNAGDGDDFEHLNNTMNTTANMSRGLVDMDMTQILTRNTLDTTQHSITTPSVRSNTTTGFKSARQSSHLTNGQNRSFLNGNGVPNTITTTTTTTPNGNTPSSTSIHRRSRASFIHDDKDYQIEQGGDYDNNDNNNNNNNNNNGSRLDQNRNNDQFTSSNGPTMSIISARTGMSDMDLTAPLSKGQPIIDNDDDDEDNDDDDGDDNYESNNNESFQLSNQHQKNHNNTSNFNPNNNNARPSYDQNRENTTNVAPVATRFRPPTQRNSITSNLSPHDLSSDRDVLQFDDSDYQNRTNEFVQKQSTIQDSVQNQSILSKQSNSRVRRSLDNRDEYDEDYSDEYDDNDNGHDDNYNDYNNNQNLVQLGNPNQQQFTNHGNTDNSFISTSTHGRFHNNQHHNSDNIHDQKSINNLNNDTNGAGIIDDDDDNKTNSEEETDFKPKAGDETMFFDNLYQQNAINLDDTADLLPERAKKQKSSGRNDPLQQEFDRFDITTDQNSINALFNDSVFNTSPRKPQKSTAPNADIKLNPLLQDDDMFNFTKVLNSSTHRFSAIPSAQNNRFDNDNDDDHYNVDGNDYSVDRTGQKHNDAGKNYNQQGMNEKVNSRSRKSTSAFDGFDLSTRDSAMFPSKNGDFNAGIEDEEDYDGQVSNNFDDNGDNNNDNNNNNENSSSAHCKAPARGDIKPWHSGRDMGRFDLDKPRANNDGKNNYQKNDTFMSYGLDATRSSYNLDDVGHHNDHGNDNTLATTAFSLGTSLGTTHMDPDDLDYTQNSLDFSLSSSHYLTSNTIQYDNTGNIAHASHGTGRSNNNQYGYSGANGSPKKYSAEFFTRLRQIQSFLQFAPLFNILDHQTTDHRYDPSAENPKTGTRRKSRLSTHVLSSLDELFAPMMQSNNPVVLPPLFPGGIIQDTEPDTDAMIQQLSSYTFETIWLEVGIDELAEHVSYLTQLKRETKSQFEVAMQELDQKAHSFTQNNNKANTLSNQTPINTYTYLLKVVREIPKSDDVKSDPKYQAAMSLLYDIKTVSDLEASLILAQKSLDVITRMATFAREDAGKEATTLLQTFAKISQNLQTYHGIFTRLTQPNMLVASRRILDNVTKISTLQTSCNMLRNDIVMLDDELTACDDEIALLEQELHELDIGYDIQRKIDNCLDQIGAQKTKNMILGMGTGWSDITHKNIAPNIQHGHYHSFGDDAGYNNNNNNNNNDRLVLMWNSNLSKYFLTVNAQGEYYIQTERAGCGIIATHSTGMNNYHQFMNFHTNTSNKTNNTLINFSVNAQSAQTIAANTAIDQCIRLVYSIFASYIDNLLQKYDLSNYNYPKSNNKHYYNNGANSQNQNQQQLLLPTLITLLNLTFTRIDSLGAQLAELFLSTGPTITTGFHENIPALYITFHILNTAQTIACDVTLPLSTNYRYCDGPLDVDLVLLPFETCVLGNNGQLYTPQQENQLREQIVSHLKSNLYSHEGAQRLLWLAFHARSYLDEAIQSVVKPNNQKGINNGVMALINGNNSTNPQGSSINTNKYNSHNNNNNNNNSNNHQRNGNVL